MTYSLDFRRHVLSVRERECLTIQETSERFSVGVASIVRWLKQPEPKATREGRPRKIDLELLAQDIRERPDDYQYERAVRFGVCRKSLQDALHKLAITHKKTIEPPESG